MQRLARAIVRDAQQAQDVAQDALVVALQRPPRAAHDPRTLRAWLTKVVRSLARRAWRDECTRARHEHSAAAPEPGDREGRTANSLQQQRELLAAVADLAEPYRTAITMRFLEGSSPRAMARALGVESAAVRQRIHRGLSMLRARLERTHGDARLAVAAIVPWSGWVPWVLPAVSIMMLKKVLVGAGAVAIAAALFVPFVGRPQGAGPAPAATPGSAVRTAADAAPAATVPAQRDAVPDAPPRSTDDVTTGTLVVRVRDGAGSALGNAPVSVWNRQRASRNTEPDGQQGTTDGDGEVRFAALAPGAWSIVVEGRTATKAEGNQVELRAGEVVVREIELRSGFTLSGVVVDAQGNVVPGARITVDGGYRRSVLAVAGAGGEFGIANLLGPAAVQARAPGRQPGDATTVTGDDGASVRVELRVGDAARRIEGRVSDAHGAPCAKALVALVPASAREQHRWEQPTRIEWERTDASGSFRSDEVAAGPYVVVAQAREPQLPPCWAEVDTARGDGFVELRAAAEGRVRGCVRRGEQGVAAAVVIAWPDAVAAGAVAVLQDLGWREAQRGGHGTFELGGLGAGPHVVRILEQGAVVHEGVVDVAPGTVQEWNVALAPLGELGIAVRGADHKHLVAMVKPTGAPADGLAGPVPLTGGEGRWRGPRAAASDVYLLFLDNKSDMVQLACRRDVLAHEPNVVFELAPADLPVRSCHGRLVDERLQPLANRRLEVHRVDGDGLVVRRAAVAGADGRFRIGPLPPGEYELRDGSRPPRVLARRFVGGTQDEDLGDVAVRTGG